MFSRLVMDHDLHEALSIDSHLWIFQVLRVFSKSVYHPKNSGETGLDPVSYHRIRYNTTILSYDV